MKKREMEMVAVRGLVLMPDSTVSFDIGRRQSKLAVKNALLQESEIFLVCQQNIEADVPSIDDLYEYGTIARIVQVDTHEKGLLRVVEFRLRIWSIWLRRLNWQMDQRKYQQVTIMQWLLLWKRKR